MKAGNWFKRESANCSADEDGRDRSRATTPLSHSLMEHRREISSLARLNSTVQYCMFFRREDHHTPQLSSSATKRSKVNLRRRIPRPPNTVQVAKYAKMRVRPPTGTAALSVHCQIVPQFPLSAIGYGCFPNGPSVGLVSSP